MCKRLSEGILMYVKNSFVQVKDQYNFQIFYVKLVENGGTKVNHAWETYGFILYQLTDL